MDAVVDEQPDNDVERQILGSAGVHLSLPFSSMSQQWSHAACHSPCVGSSTTNFGD
jgi:hypothetical protein